MWPGTHQLPKITSLLFLRNIVRKNSVIKLIFCMQINMKACYKLIVWFWWGCSSIPKVPKIASFQCICDISKKKLKRKLIFCTQININSTSWYYQFLMEVARHIQNTHNRKLVIFLQYVKKNCWNCFLVSSDAKHSDSDILQGSSHVYCYLLKKF